MTGSHEVRGSIPLGSTNTFNKLGVAPELPLTALCAYSVPTLKKHVSECAVALEKDCLQLFSCRLLHGG